LRVSRRHQYTRCLGAWEAVNTNKPYTTVLGGREYVANNNFGRIPLTFKGAHLSHHFPPFPMDPSVYPGTT
jgi:hypothetical protein